MKNKKQSMVLFLGLILGTEALAYLEDTKRCETVSCVRSAILGELDSLQRDARVYSLGGVPMNLEEWNESPFGFDYNTDYRRHIDSYLEARVERPSSPEKAEVFKQVEAKRAELADEIVRIYKRRNTVNIAFSNKKKALFTNLLPLVTMQPFLEQMVCSRNYDFNTIIDQYSDLIDLRSEIQTLNQQRIEVNQTLFNTISFRALLAAHAIEDYSGKTPLFHRLWSSFEYRGLSKYGRQAARILIDQDLKMNEWSLSKEVLEVYNEIKAKVRADAAGG